ncbi:MAG: glutaminyl-peptide cyclotransferase [Taibaiella sp.]|nr:glutaminyl-peptide cyclotransferase [Taibaiella sp.]
MITNRNIKALLVVCLLLAACNNNSTEEKQPVAPTAQPSGPAIISYQLVAEYPHDAGAFTEGLQYIDGKLYESTGQYGASDVRITDLKTGKVLLANKMDKKYFGEGLTVLNGNVYQLTYRENAGFVYDAIHLKVKNTFRFNTEEGWGMTNDGTYLIYDDGDNNLIYLDAKTFAEVKRVPVKDNGEAVDNINELEYIKGYIYANRWKTDIIYKIDPHTGEVVAKADLSDLRQKGGIAEMSMTTANAPEVLNGIAYDSTGNRIFITGKFWPKIFEIKLDN